MQLDAGSYSCMLHLDAVLHCVQCGRLGQPPGGNEAAEEPLEAAEEPLDDGQDADEISERDSVDPGTRF